MAGVQLFNAIARKDLEEVQRLISDGVDLSCEDRDGVSPLHRAVQGGDIAIVTALVDAGADLVKTDRGGSTPLHYACRYMHDNLEVVKFIELRGRNKDIVNVKDNELGWIPLHVASIWGHTDIVQYLLALEHCNPTIRESSVLWGRRTPLDLAVLDGRRDIITLFTSKWSLYWIYFDNHEYEFVP